MEFFIIAGGASEAPLRNEECLSVGIPTIDIIIIYSIPNYFVLIYLYKLTHQ